MSVIELIRQIFENGDAEASLLMLVTVPLIALLVFRMIGIKRNMRTRGEPSEYMLLFLPGFLYFVDALLLFFFSFLILSDANLIMERVEAVVGEGRLHTEALVQSVILLALCVLYSMVSKRRNDRAARRPLPLLILIQNPIELVFGVFVLARAAMALGAGAPLSAQGLSEMQMAVYLFGVLLVAFHVVCVLVALIWSALLGRRGNEEVGKGPDPLARLRYKIRRQSIRNTLAWLLMMGFLFSIIGGIMYQDMRARPITGPDDPFEAWRWEYVAVRPRSLRDTGGVYNDGALLYAEIDARTGIYVLCDPAQVQRLLANPTGRIVGKLYPLNNIKPLTDADGGQTLPNLPSYYVNGMAGPEYGVIYLILGLLAVALLTGMRFYLPAINPNLSRSIRPLRRLYPGFDEMIAEIREEEADPARCYYKDNQTVLTASYAVTERFETIRLIAYRQIAAIHPDGELQFQVHLHSGGIQALSCPNEKAREAVVQALREHWRIKPTPRPVPQAPPPPPPPPIYPQGGAPGQPGYPQGAAYGQPGYPQASAPGQPGYPQAPAPGQPVYPQTPGHPQQSYPPAQPPFPQEPYPPAQPPAWPADAAPDENGRE